MEQRITSNSERAVTTLVNDVEHIESQSLNGIAVVKIYFQPNANIQTAAGANHCDRANHSCAPCRPARRRLWWQSIPPSTVPVIQIGMTSDSLSEQAALRFRKQFYSHATRHRAGRRAALSLRRQTAPDLGRSRHHTRCSPRASPPVDIVNAINAQNLILPTGTAKLGTLEYMVEMNGSPQTVAGLNDLPIKTVNGATIYMRDVAHIRDGFSPQTNIVRANGQRGVLDGGVQNRQRLPRWIS